MKRVKLTEHLPPYGSKGDIIDVSDFHSEHVLKYAELIEDLGPYRKGVKKKEAENESLE